MPERKDDLVMANAEAISDWLQWCESNPDQWRRGEVEIPPAEVDLTSAEVSALFQQPTLTAVRQSVEQLLEHLMGTEGTTRRSADSS